MLFQNSSFLFHGEFFWSWVLKDCIQRNKVGSCCVRFHEAKHRTGFKRYATTRNNMQLGVRTDATCSIQQCCELLANNVAFVCTGLKLQKRIRKSLSRVHLSSFTSRDHARTAKKCTKKRDVQSRCFAKLNLWFFVCFCFLPFSMPSSLLKLPYCKRK